MVTYPAVIKEDTLIKVALVITTYNWVPALKKCLDSVLLQSVIPNEIIIADDGSTNETKNLINSYKELMQSKLIHSWQPDEGFRLSRSRNLAISKAESDYIIVIDGDIIMHPDFIKDHILNASYGQFVSGRRVRLAPAYSEKLMNTDLMPSPFSRGIYRGREQAFRIPLLSKLLSSVSEDTNRIHGCNMAFWRKDLIRVNGFNNEFVGWGAEDKEFCARLLILGIKKKKLKFAAVAFHIYHDESSRALKLANDIIYRKTIDKGIPFCDTGIDEFISSINISYQSCSLNDLKAAHLRKVKDN